MKRLTKEDIEKNNMKMRLRRKLSEDVITISDGKNTYNLTRSEFNSALNEAINRAIKKGCQI